MHEASLYESNCFVTLTYADEHLPAHGSLRKRDFVLFMKRLRLSIAPARVRYFHCGEYGAVTSRPHYHVLLFGYDFPDKRPWTVRNGLQVFRSEKLESLWSFGNTEIGSVTFESASYVARYVVDKITGSAAEAHYSRVDLATGEVIRVESEYSTMSRRPGIGAGWFAKYGKEVYPADSVVARGRLMKPPRFYDGQFEIVDPEGFSAVKRDRERKRRASAGDATEERLVDREICASAQLATYRKDEL